MWNVCRRTVGQLGKRSVLQGFHWHSGRARTNTETLPEPSLPQDCPTPRGGLRVDTTVVEADVRMPTDSRLCAHAVSRLTRGVHRLKRAGLATRTRMRDHRRAAGRVVPASRPRSAGAATPAPRSTPDSRAARADRPRGRR